MKIDWHQITDLKSRSYTCGHCGESLASKEGYFALDNSRTRIGNIYVCHFCSCPTFFGWDGKQHPGSVFGDTVQGVDDQDVSNLYDEARNCMKVGAYTSSVLCCRKLLMHIAVSKGAKEGDTFLKYVEYLAKNYVAHESKFWVDHIRSKGNDANHEIKIMTKDDAETLLTFSSVLLKIIYEFPSKLPKPS